MNLNSQSTFFGLGGGVQLSNFYLQNKSIEDNSLKTNIYFGAEIQKKIHGKLFLKSGIIYIEPKALFETSNNLYVSINELNYKFIEIPICFRYNIYKNFNFVSGLNNSFRINSEINTSYYPQQFSTGNKKENYDKYTNFYHLSLIYGVSYFTEIKKNYFMEFCITGNKSLSKIENQIDIESNTNIYYNNLRFFISILKVI